MWGTLLSNYKYFSSQSSCLLLLLEVRKDHYRKENISVFHSEQLRDALFWTHLRETWLNEFISLQVSLSFSIFIFSTGIKLFIQHPVVLFGILIKTDSHVFINTWNTEFYISLSLRQNKSRYKIWHWLEIGCFCKWKQSTNKEI